MKTIRIPVSDLLSKAIQMTNDSMVEVELTLIDEVTDQGKTTPQFLNFVGFKDDGAVFDYESIDSAAFSTLNHGKIVVFKRPPDYEEKVI